MAKIQIPMNQMNVKEDLKENASDIPKNNTLENNNDFSTDHIDVVDKNIITDGNSSNQNNIPESVLDNRQLIHLVVNEDIAKSKTSSNNSDALPNTTSIDTDDMLTQVRKNEPK